MKNWFYIFIYLSLKIQGRSKRLRLTPKRQAKNKKTFVEKDFYGDAWPTIKKSLDESTGAERISLIENIEEDKRAFRLSS